MQRDGIVCKCQKTERICTYIFLLLTDFSRFHDPNLLSSAHQRRGSRGEEQQAIDAMAARTADVNQQPPKCEANYAPLTPLLFLERAASVHGDRVSVIYGDLSYTWAQTFERCRRLASAVSMFASAGDTVLLLLLEFFFLQKFKFCFCFLLFVFAPSLLHSIIRMLNSCTSEIRKQC
jgi:hypothetical protein